MEFDSVEDNLGLMRFVKKLAGVFERESKAKRDGEGRMRKFCRV